MHVVHCEICKQYVELMLYEWSMYDNVLMTGFIHFLRSVKLLSVEELCYFIANVSNTKLFYHDCEKCFFPTGSQTVVQHAGCHDMSSTQ